MDSNFPQDLLDLKNRIDHWRLTRRFVREALPAELREAIIQILSHHPVSLIKKALKLDPYRFRTSSINTSSALGILSSSVTLRPLREIILLRSQQLHDRLEINCPISRLSDNFLQVTPLHRRLTTIAFDGRRPLLKVSGNLRVAVSFTAPSRARLDMRPTGLT